MYIDADSAKCLRKVWKNLTNYEETLCYKCIPGYVIGRTETTVMGSKCWISPHTACVAGTIKDNDCSKCWGPYILDY